MKLTLSPITRIVKRRRKPRPGRLDKKGLEALRLACYENDPCCINCGCVTSFYAPQEYDIAFHMAHTKGKRMHGDSLANVHTECGACHRSYHQNGPSRVKPCPKKVRSDENAIQENA